MHRNTWKGFERTVASFFGTERTPLSGGNSKITRSDTLHELLFIECKQREKSATWKLWEDTKLMADSEGKIPILALKQNHKPGFLIVVHCDNIGSAQYTWANQNNKIGKQDATDTITIRDVIEGRA